jgi:hypothetical protein
MLHPFLRHALVALFLEQGDSAVWVKAEWAPEEVWTKRIKEKLRMLLGKEPRIPVCSIYAKINFQLKYINTGEVTRNERGRRR